MATAAPTPRRDPAPDEWLLTTPSLLWLLVLFAAPTLLVFAIACRAADPFGGIGGEWTLAAWRQLWQPALLPVLWRTCWLSGAATAICVLLALPTGYCLARAPRAWRAPLLLAIIVPFWTSFLIRIFAWKVLLHPDGALKHALAWVGVVEAEATLLYHPATVLLVLVYTCLPFAILPIYAAAERFDYTLLEAARDLGATRWQAWRRVFLPGVRRGIVAAVLLVFIPALGTYIIPDLVGGPAGEMLGNKIAQRTFVDRNLPLASALAALLMLAVLMPLAAVLVLRRQRAAPVPPSEAT